MIAVIMAGGLGTRLRPLTYSIPKPLLPVGEKPILEIIIEKLKSQKVTEIILATGYRSDLIHAYFGDGSKLGVKITYVREEKPLGTAGSLSLMRKKLDSAAPFLVMNGDILTKLDFNKMHDYHISCGSMMTIASIKHQHQLPFGVLRIENKQVLSIEEKPSFQYDVSAGIYILNPDALPLIPKNRYFTIPNLIDRLIQKREKIFCYPVKEYWMAVEQMDQFTQAATEKKWE